MAPPRSLTLTETDEIIHLLSIGLSTQELGHKFKCSHNTIRLIAIKNKIPMSLKERRRLYAYDLIVNQCKTPSEVAEMTGLKLKTIYTYVKSPEEKAIRRTQRLERQNERQKQRETEKEAEKRQRETEKAEKRAEAAKRAAVKRKESSPPPPNPDVRKVHDQMFYRFRRSKPVPSTLTQDEIADQIANFIQSRGITKCPTAAVAPTTGSHIALTSMNRTLTSSSTYPQSVGQGS